MQPRRSAFIVPSLAILAFAAFLGFSLVRLAQVEQDMRSNVDENMLWVITQAQVASHRLDNAVARHWQGDPTADPQLRFDVLTSRLVLLDQGPQRRYLERLGFADTLQDLAERLEIIEGYLEVLLSQETADGATLYPLLAPMMTQLNRIANAVMVQEWEATGARLDAHRASMIQAIASLLGILFSGLLLGALLFHALHQRRIAQHALACHRDELEEQVLRRTQDLETQRQRVVDAIDTAPDGFAAFDAEERLVLTNPQLQELLPITDEQLKPGLTLGELLKAIRRQSRAEESQREGYTYHEGLQCDLELIDHHWRQLMLRRTEDGGQVLRVADITRYKAAAQALEDALQRERGVSEFYRSFAALVSHQFRTPLAVIDSGLQRLLRRDHSMNRKARLERYHRLREAVAQMTRLIDSSLTAARLDGGQVEAHVEAYDLVSLAEQACRLQEEANDAQPSLLLTAEERPLLAWCDRSLVEQILANLLSNAAKYAPQGSPIRVTLGRSGHRLYCHVQDQGIGISAEELPKVFERFFRSRSAAGLPGIGLGLNIARHLARIQQGDVTASVAEEQGTTFTLWLPAATGRDDHADADQ